VESDVYGMLDALGDETFDVVYTSRGVLGWLPDIDRWAGAVASRVAPGGIFYLYEVHPVVQTIAEEQAEHGWNHPLGRIVTGLARNGLRIELLDEKPWLEWELPWLQELGDERWGFPPGQRGTIPLMWSLRARRDG
jgi:SAM-dependent methyltransferase